MYFGGEAIASPCWGIASGKEQKRPRNDMPCNFFQTSAYVLVEIIERSST